MDGWLYGVLKTGPYRGHLVFGQQPYRRAHAGANPVTVVSRSGEVVLVVPGSESEDGRRSLTAWLEEKGWVL